jgi:hypothetical protein
MMITKDPIGGTRATKVINLLTALALIASCSAANAQTTLRADAMASCGPAQEQFASWFTSGTVTLNGGVGPADGIAFASASSCGFFNWAGRNFLWLTSPAPSNYGLGGHVFNSPIFYDVLPPDPTSGRRTLAVNAAGKFRELSARLSQLGPRHKPVMFDRTGKMFTVIHPQVGPSGKSLIRNKAGHAVEIAHTRAAPNGKPIFLDKTGKPIDYRVSRNGNPQLLDESGKAIAFQKAHIVINGRTFFLDGAGNVIDTEQGQSDENVLMAQNGSLVYYAIQVNDVYAYFLTGTKNGGISPQPTQFPTTQPELDQITAFGAAHSKTFPDPNALAIVVKSSWIETTGLDVSKFVTMTATIPTYDTSDPAHWVQNGSRQTRLALVGMHVVGSAAAHLEMIWSTFEHVDNTRNAQFVYTNTAGNILTAPQLNGGTWLFSETPPTDSPNQPRMVANGANIDAIPGETIGPSDILRINPWGSRYPTNETQAAFFAPANSEVISFNRSIVGMLADGDVRKNYLMIGTTWTITGGPPNDTNQVGTNQLANSTMETFFQPSNCFSCHKGNMLGTLVGPPPTPPVGEGLSHIFGTLTPLFP